MKRCVSILLATVLILTFAGCRDLFQSEDGSDLFDKLTEWANQTKDAAEKNLGWSVTFGEVEFDGTPDLPGFSAVADRFQPSGVTEGELYQYSALSGKEQEMYRAVVSGIRQGKTAVNFSDYHCDTKKIFKIYRAATTDHPEFFFMAKSFLYTISSSGEVGKLILLYSDGETSDQYDKNGKLTASADRETIDRQIAAFSQRIAELKTAVRTGDDVWGIEKQLHDLVIDEVAYDDATAKAVNDPSAPESHAFDAYGAACEGKAVCEGYSKLFQHLCGCFGFNCTTVSGTAEGDSHMWNAVKVNGAWTLVDVTWDDAGKRDLRYYKCFNLTDSAMKQDHHVEEKELSVPECVSEEGAFTRRFAFSASSLKSAPDNYKEVLDRLAAGGDRFVCLAAKGSQKELGRYLGEQFLDPVCKVRQYIDREGYDIEFSEENYITDAYLYLVLL